MREKNNTFIHFPGILISKSRLHFEIEILPKNKHCRRVPTDKDRVREKREATANEIAAKIENISFLDYNRNLYGFVGSSSEKKRIQKIYIY